MSRSSRLFEIIQLLRSASKPITADQIAHALEVSTRTIYRDIAVLQSMRTPIEGEAGIGYIMRSGYDLPPLNFNAEEVEALIVGLGLLARTGDAGLKRAAAKISEKIDALGEHSRSQNDNSIKVSDWGVIEKDNVSATSLRNAIRNEQKIILSYCDLSDNETKRTVLPIAITYYIEVVVMLVWCELRCGFRNFRVDRIQACTLLDDYFTGQGNALRKQWEANQNE